MTGKDTGTLQEELRYAEDVIQFTEENAKELHPQSVPEYLNHLLIVHDVAKVDVVKRAGFEGNTYVYQIFNGRKTAGRDKLLQLSFGFPLTVEETQRLLRCGGYSELYVRDKRDVVCMHGLQKKMTLEECNAYLYRMGEAPLC